MSKIEKISVALPSEMVAAIREAVESGDYATNSDVMRDALRDWRMRRRVEEIEIEEMRRLVKEGVDSGRSPDGEVELARLRAKYAPTAKTTTNEKAEA